jgi:hypothetical protein
MAVWALILSGQGHLGTVVMPDWLWQATRLPLVGGTSPTGMALPVAGALALFIAVLFARRASFTTRVLVWDVLAINLYLLLVSTLPQAGLEVNAWAGAVFIFLVGAWQIVWLSGSRRQRSMLVATAPMNATPAEVVELLSDLSRRPEWMPALESDVLLYGERAEVGATYLETVRNGHTRTLVELRLSEKITDKRVSLHVLGPYVLIEDYAVSETPQGCLVSITHVREVSYPLALVGGAWWWGRVSSSRLREVANLGRLASVLTESPGSTRVGGSGEAK